MIVEKCIKGLIQAGIKMKRNIIVILMLLLMSVNVNALTWQEQRVIASEIGRELDYDGSFRFAYYQDWRDYYAFYNRDNGNDGVITFYKPSLKLNKEEFVCVVYHELGHSDEYIHEHARGVLSEDYANDFMKNHC